MSKLGLVKSSYDLTKLKFQNLCQTDKNAKI